MRSVKFLVAAGAVTLLSSAAFAADMPSIMPPPQPYYAPPPVEDFGGWYLRGDIGFSNQNVKSMKLDDPAHYSTLSSFNQTTDFDSAGTYQIGVGYQFNNWFRADVTGQYRGSANFKGTDRTTFPWGGSTASGIDNYSASKSEILILANAYADLGTWWCLTPFVGAGVGAAHITTTGLQDSGLTFAPGFGSGNPSSFFANGASTTNLAWALHAGVAYKVTNNFTVELAYRYLDMGTAVHGFGSSFDGSNAGPSSFTFRDLTSQDVKLGVRWTCCDVEPAAPPVLMRKG